MWFYFLIFILLFKLVISGWDVTGPMVEPKSSSPPSWRWFILKIGGLLSSSYPSTKGIKSVTLKAVCTPYSSRRPNWYALLLTFLRIWKWPSPWGWSLDFLFLWNISFLKWSQTRSPIKDDTSFPLIIILSVSPLFGVVFVV